MNRWREPFRGERMFAGVALVLAAKAVLPLLQEMRGEPYDVSTGDRLSQVAFGVVYVTAALLLVASVAQGPRHTFRGLLSRGLLSAGRSGIRLAVGLPILALVGLAASSVLWSISPEVTSRSVLGLLGATVLGAYLGTRFRGDSFVEVIAYTLIALIIASYALAILLPDWGLMSEPHLGAWRGLFAHKNAFGRVLGLGAVVFLVLGVSRWSVAWLIASLATLPGLVLARSVTSFLAVVATAGLLTLIIQVRLGGERRLFVSGAVAGGLVGAATSATAWILGLLGREGTLTGRTKIWALLLPVAGDRLLVGYGYRSSWLREGPTSVLSSAFAETPRNAHNGYLELLLELGVMGLVCWLAVLVILLVLSIKVLFHGSITLSEEVVGLSGFGMVAFLMAINLTEAVTLFPNDMFWVLTVAWTVQAARAGTERQIHRASA